MHENDGDSPEKECSYSLVGDIYAGDKFEIGNLVTQKVLEAPGEKVKKVLGELDDWATPYECYKIALEQEEVKEVSCF